MEEKNKKSINRRDFIKIVGISAATSTAILYGCSSKGTSSSNTVLRQQQVTVFHFWDTVVCVGLLSHLPTVTVR